MRYGVGFLLLATLVLIVSAAGYEGSDKQPVYVGARVCGSCHEGSGMGHQFSKWLMSKHAEAYAALALPEARAAWPPAAAQEYQQLLRELDTWSREHDWPMSSNSWIAEEAVRRSW